MAQIAMFGSGEFLPWASPVDRWSAETGSAGGRRTVLVCPTASAPEGDETFDRWGRMAIDHYTSLGLEPEVLALRTREDASMEQIVHAPERACLVFFSGGNPGYLAETLRDTPFWSAVLAAAARGTVIGGCSAGASAFGAQTFWVEGDGLGHWVPGLDLLPKAFILPHFDELDTYRAGLRRSMLMRRPAGTTVVGLDEETALFGTDGAWQVAGRGAVWIGQQEQDLHAYRDGDDALVHLGLPVG